MPKLSGEERGQLREAMLSAYPSLGDLKIFADEKLDKNIDELDGSGLNTKVSNLISWARAQGRVEKLIEELAKDTQNPNIQAFCNRFRQKSPNENTAGIKAALVDSNTTLPNPQDLANTSKKTNASLSGVCSNAPVEVFISYTHSEEALKDKLAVHMASLINEGKIKLWQDRDIEAGAEWDAEIKTRLESARIILLLVTPGFIASKYCSGKEMKRAMERHENGTAKVIPIIMKPSDWKNTPFSKLQALPKDSKPITKWEDQDEAFLDVVQGVRKAIESLISQS